MAMRWAELGRIVRLTLIPVLILALIASTHFTLLPTKVGGRDVCHGYVVDRAGTMVALHPSGNSVAGSGGAGLKGYLAASTATSTATSTCTCTATATGLIISMTGRHGVCVCQMYLFLFPLSFGSMCDS